MKRDRRRTGATLVELLAAMPLLALLSVIAAILVLDAQRTARSVDGHTARGRELRHAAVVVTTQLRGARARDIMAWNDTLLEFDATTGVAFACGQSAPDKLDLLPAIGDDPLRATWSGAPDAGDRVLAAVHGPHPTDSSSVVTRTIAAVGSSTTGCANVAVRAGLPGAVVRLTLAGSLPTPVIIGTPVRILRRTRISLYKSSDNDWYMGMRTLTPSGWETTQPVAGPLASAADRGLRFSLHTRTAAPLTAHSALLPVDSSLGAQPAQLDLLLRATSPWRTRIGLREVDSLVTTIVFRGR